MSWLTGGEEGTATSAGESALVTRAKRSFSEEVTSYTSQTALM